MRSTQAAHRKIVNEELHGPKFDATISRVARQPDALQIARHDHVMSILVKNYTRARYHVVLVGHKCLTN